MNERMRAGLQGDAAAVPAGAAPLRASCVQVACKSALVARAAIAERPGKMVGATGIEPVTPTMSR